MNVEIKNCPIEVANDIWNAAIEEAAKVPDKLAQKNIAVAIGQAFNFNNSEISTFKLDRFVEACTKEW